MKRTFLIAVCVTLMASPLFAQQFYPTWTGDAGANATKRIPLYCPTEKAYVVRDSIASNDTSAIYNLPPYSEAWLVTKMKPAHADVDSAYTIMWVQFRNTADYAAAGYDVGWQNCDSSMFATADTVGGDFKKIQIPPNSQVRFIWGDYAGKRDDQATTLCSSWLYLKRFGGQ